MSIESEQPLPSGVGLIEVAFEWVHPNGTPFGADLGALLLGPDERVGRDADFIFYNQPTSPDGAVRLGEATDRREHGRQSREGKAMYVDLDTLSSQVRGVILVASVDTDISPEATLAVPTQLRLRVQDTSSGRVIWQVDLNDLPPTTALVLAEFRRNEDGWQLGWVGQTYGTGLAGIATAFGVDVEGEEQRAAAQAGGQAGGGLAVETPRAPTPAGASAEAARRVLHAEALLIPEAAFVADLVQRLPEDTMLLRVGHHLRAVVHKCGRQRVGAQWLATLEERLAEHGIYARPRLTEPGVTPATMLYFSRVKAPQLESGLLFHTEAALRDFLVANYRYIPGLDHLLKPRPEFHLDSGDRIDILFTERGTGALVVTELKLGAPPDGLVEQVFRYIEQLRRMRMAEGRKIKGLLVTGQPAFHLVQHVLETGKARRIDIIWFYYRAACNLYELASWPEQGQFGE